MWGRGDRLSQDISTSLVDSQPRLRSLSHKQTLLCRPAVEDQVQQNYFFHLNLDYSSICPLLYQAWVMVAVAYCRSARGVFGPSFNWQLATAICCQSPRRVHYKGGLLYSQHFELWDWPTGWAPIGVFDMPNSSWFDISSISIFWAVSLSMLMVSKVSISWQSIHPYQDIDQAYLFRSLNSN